MERSPTYVGLQDLVDVFKWDVEEGEDELPHRQLVPCLRNTGQRITSGLTCLECRWQDTCPRLVVCGLLAWQI